MTYPVRDFAVPESFSAVSWSQFRQKQVGINVAFEGVEGRVDDHAFLVLRSHEVASDPLDGFSVEHSWIQTETSTVMHRIRDVASRGLFQEIQFADDRSIQSRFLKRLS